MKKLFVFLVIVLMLPSLSFAQDDSSEKGFFGSIWSGVSGFFSNLFGGDDSSQKNSGSSSSSNKNYVSPKPLVLDIGGYSLNEDSIKDVVNSNEEIKGYIKSFNYECLSIESDKGVKFTAYMDTSKGTLRDLKSGLHCTKEVYFEESLVGDLEGGFEAKKIKTYLEKVDLPTSMYFKAIKVFTIG